MAASVEIGFEKRCVVIDIDQIASTKLVSPAIKGSKKFEQILVSVREVGIVEPLVVHRLDSPERKYVLLDGHLRLEALRDLGQREAPCLLAKDDDAFSYNKRINRLSSVQEHYMILRAIKSGASEQRLARVLGVNVQRIRQKSKLLDGICDEVADILKDKKFSTASAGILRRMKPIRQIEIAELMVAANNYSSTYARALMMATPADQLKEPKKKKPVGGLSVQEQDAMEREMETLQRDIKAVEENYGENILNLVVANGYLSRLLDNEKVAGYMRRHYGELHRQLGALQESIATDVGM